MNKEELEKEIEDWWRIKFRVELKGDICQKLTIDEAEELCNKIAEPREKRIEELEKENAKLRKVAEFQQSSNMNTHLENKKLKEGLTVGSMWNKHLNSQNKALEEERDRYRNMVFDLQKENTELKKQQLSLKNERNTFLAQNEQYEKDLIDFNEQLTTAKEIIKLLLWDIRNRSYEPVKDLERAEQFLKDSEVE